MTAVDTVVAHDDHAERRFERMNQAEQDHQVILETKEVAKASTPEELAEQLGVTMAELPSIILKKTEELTDAMARITQGVTPVKPNRAMRRARKFNHNPGRFPSGTKRTGQQ